MKKIVGAAPWIFILIWSSGFVVAKYGFEDADSLFFLAIRLILAAVILFVLTAALRQPLTLSRADLRASLAIGIALHGFYLAGVWYAIELGAPAGLSSVITSMQPIVVSLLAVRLLSEPLTRRQVAGLIFGLLGVFLVVLPKLSKAEGFTTESLLFLFLALAGSTVATLLQKKIGHSIPLHDWNHLSICNRWRGITSHFNCEREERALNLPTPPSGPWRGRFLSHRLQRYYFCSGCSIEVRLRKFQVCSISFHRWQYCKPSFSSVRP